MKYITTISLVTTSVLLSPLIAHASYLEACELHGVVQSVALSDARGDGIVLSLKIEIARAEEIGGLEGNTDCQRHVGERIDMYMPAAMHLGRTIREGDLLVVLRSVVDDSAGRSNIKIELREHKARSSAEL